VVVIVEDAHCGTPAIVAISLTIWTVINGTLTGAATTFVPTGPMCAGIDQLSGGDYMCRFRDLTQVVQNGLMIAFFIARSCGSQIKSRRINTICDTEPVCCAAGCHT